MGCGQATTNAPNNTPNNNKKHRIRNSYRKLDLHSDNITEEF